MYLVGASLFLCPGLFRLACFLLNQMVLGTFSSLSKLLDVLARGSLQGDSLLSIEKVGKV